jgi:hypothetical protein
VIRICSSFSETSIGELEAIGSRFAGSLIAAQETSKAPARDDSQPMAMYFEA